MTQSYNLSQLANNLNTAGQLDATDGLIGAVPPVNGGTGQASYTVGDLLYASGATALAKLSDVATGNALISGGAGAAPSYAKIGLTTHISGTLAVSNGGTGSTNLGSGQVLLGGGTSAVTGVPPTPGDNFLMSNGSTWIGSNPFGASLNANGYQRITGGLIIQWGLFIGTLAPGATMDVTYNTAYSSSVYYAGVSVQGTGLANDGITFPICTVPSVDALIKFTVKNTDLDSSITIFRWVSIGV